CQNGFTKDELHLMTSVHISLGLVLHQMVSTENNTSGPASFFIKWCLLKITLQAPFLNVQMTSVLISSGLVLHHNDVCSHQFRPHSSS
ncbi:hypothetical protein Tco_1151819, partial [Tanacetum coccineum]